MFETSTIPPIKFLAELREEVLQHSHKRMPKWKFRLAPDLIFQLQPRPAVMPSEAAMARGLKPKLEHFEGIAAKGESVAATIFERLPERSDPPWCKLNYELFSENLDADWIFKPTGGRWRRGIDQSEISVIIDRLVAAFRGKLFDGQTPAKMLSPNCVLCGKGLTDPASMARWIGPCASTSSLRVPFTLDVSEGSNQPHSAATHLKSVP